jgi:hypothetical protein
MKTLKTFIAILTVLGTITVTQAFAGNFKDISNSEIYKTGIEFLQDEGIISGYPDGTFMPERVLNRAEMLKIVTEGKFIYEGESADVLEDYAEESCFEDVPKGEWYTKYVCYAKAQNWVEGYENGKLFKPAQEVNFVEAVKMTLEGFEIEYEETDDIWYRGFIERASEQNFLPYDVEAFDQQFRRNQMADLMTRIIKESLGLLEDYLGEMADLVVTFETLSDGRNLANENRNRRYNQNLELGEFIFDPDTTDLISAFSYWSPEDPHRVFAILEVRAGDMDLVEDYPMEFIMMSPAGEDGISETAFYYTSTANCSFLGLCSEYFIEELQAEIQSEAEEIASSFAFSGDASGSGCWHVSNFDFNMQFPESWGKIDEVVLLDEAYWGELADYSGQSEACTKYNFEYPEYGDSDDLTYDEQKAIWRAEVEAEYDLATCQATDFPEIMMFKWVVIYEYCNELYDAESAENYAGFESLVGEIDDVADSGDTITWDEYYEYLDILLSYRDNSAISSDEYWDAYDKIEELEKDPESNPRINGITWLSLFSLHNSDTYEIRDSEVLITGDISIEDDSYLYIRNAIIKLDEGSSACTITVSGNATLELEDVRIEDLDSITWVFEDNANIILDNVTVEGDVSDWYTKEAGVTITEL